MQTDLYAGYQDTYEAYIDLLKTAWDLNEDEFLAKYFELWKFTNCLSSILLDSDQLQENSQLGRKSIVVRTFEFIDHVCCRERTAQQGNFKRVLEIVEKQPGLMKNLVFNLNQREDADPVVLGYQVSLIGSMCQYLEHFQQDACMINAGTYNLIFVMSRMSDKSSM